jgi:fibronectin-binding autotransporter adhesin
MNMQAPKRSVSKINSTQTIMKTSLHHLATLSILAAVTLLPHLAGAASATWLASPTDGNWEATGSENNWSTGVATWPGGNSTSSGDTATFNNNSSVTSISLNGTGGWNIKNITFDTANCAAYTINNPGGQTCRMTSGGAITINSAVTQSQAITGSQLRLHGAGGLNLVNNSSTSTATLTVATGLRGNNSPANTTPFDQAVNLQGSNLGSNVVSAAIVDYDSTETYVAAVTKSGAGTWYLTAANTYKGPTSITAGTLVLTSSGSINSSTNIIVSGGTLRVTGSMNQTHANSGMAVSGSGTIVITNTAFRTPVTVGTFSATGATLHLGVNGSALFTNIVATTALNVSGTVTLAIDQVATVLGATTFPLISYAGTDPAAGNFSVTVPAGYTAGAVTVDTVNKLVTVTVTPAVVATPLAWVGVTNSVLISNWDTNNTRNWVDQATRATPMVYLDPDSVLFDDAAPNGTVTLTMAVTPFGVTVNNSTRNYTFNGSGKISGAFGLTKQGTATLTLAETGGDDFSGGVTNSGGTLILDNANSAISGGLVVASGATVQIGQNDAKGAVPAGSVDVEGTLTFSRSDSVTVPNAILGAGSLVQNGSGTLTLNNNNGYTGPTTVSKGKLALAGAGTISNSYTLVVNNAAFDVSGVAGTTLLQDFNITQATLNVGPTNTQTPISVNSFEVDGVTGTSNIVNVLALPPIASYPVTLTLIKSAGTITLTAGNFNFALGSLPSGSPAYAGGLSESSDSTAILLTLTSGPVGVRPSVTWAGVVYTSADTNWSDRVNWTLPGVPVTADNVYFDGTTTVGDSLTVNNVVDTSFTINSLTYNQNGAGAFHVTQISDGQTLTVSGPVTVGNLPSADGTQTPTYMTGGGTFVANGTPFTVVNFGVSTGNSLATLDLSGLSNFIYGNSSGIMNIANATSGNRFGGMLRLAGVSNNVTAGTINFFVNNASNAGNGNSGFQLGAGTNVINVGAFNIVAAKNSGTVQFVATAPSTAGLRLRGVNGNTDDSSRATITLGNRNTGGTGTTTGNLSLNGYPVDIKAGTITIGEDNQSGGNTGSGTLSFDTGTVDATTINMAIAVNAAATTATGTINVGANAMLVIGSGGLSLVNQTGLGVGTGNLNLSGGTVICSNSIVKTTAAGTGNISLTGGALNMVSGTIGTPAARIDALNLNGGSTIQLNVLAGVTNIVATAVNVGGTTTININSIFGVTSRTQIPIISYNNGVSPIGGLVLGTIPARASDASLVDNPANQTVDLLITPPAPYVWVGAVGSTLNSAWNTSTLNWLDGAAPSAYFDNNYALFSDTASNAVVTPAIALSPAGITVSNNVLSYTFTGSAGKISGPGGLVKTGSGTLTLAETGGDNFSGGIAVNNGTVILDNANSSTSGGATIASGATLQVGNNDGNGALPSGMITMSGSLLFNQTVNQAVSNVIAGAGTLTQGGANVLTLSGTNTFTGPAVVLAGSTLRLDNSNALGTADSGTTINSGGTLDVGAPDLAANGLTVLEPVTVSGAGVNSAGAIINSSTNQQQNALRYVTLAGDTTWGGPGTFAPNGGNPGRWDIRYVPTTGTNAVLSTSGQPYKLTKIGPNQMSIVGAMVDSALGDIDIQQGLVGFEGGTTSMGNPASNLTVRAGATLSFYNTTNLWNKVFSLNGNGINPSITNWSGTNTIIGPVTLNGNCVFGVGGTSLALTNNLLKGPGGLTKTSTGTLYLGGTNTFAGNTTISAGTLALLGDTMLTNSPVITIAPGATLDVSARSTTTLPLISGQTLFGAGTLNGGLAPAAGATVSPGTGPGVIGTLTSSDGVSLQGTTYMEIAKTNTPATNDLLVANTLIEAGALYVTNLDAAHPPVSGDSFKLFRAVFFSGGGFSPIVLPPLAAGLSWTNTLLTDGTISVIGTATVVSQPSITGITLSGTDLMLSGTAEGTATYYVLMSTDVAKPLNQWTRISTNVLSGAYTITVANGVSAGDPKRFYTLQAQ